MNSSSVEGGIDLSKVSDPAIREKIRNLRDYLSNFPEGQFAEKSRLELAKIQLTIAALPDIAAAVQPPKLELTQAEIDRSSKFIRTGGLPD